MLQSSERLFVASFDLLAPELENTNDGRERALRIEKCILNGFKFRKTKRGRAVLEILRTISAICTSAKLDLTVYLSGLPATKIS